MKTPIVVTGASGFVGQHLCASLAAAGHDVRAVVRQRDRESSLESSAEIAVVSNPESPSDWNKVLLGANAVVHLIARTHSAHADSGQLEAYRQVNVHITEALLEACGLCGVRRFVYLSSIKAVGEGAPNAYDELTPCAPEDAYGVTKREAELVVAETAARTGMDVVVLRPPLIYGPGVKGNFLQSLELVDHGFPFPISGIHNKRSMLYIENLTSAIATLLGCDRFPEPIFHVADGGEPLSTQDLVRQLGYLMGKKVALFPAPKLLLRLGGNLLGRGDLVDRLVGSLTVSTGRIQRVLGWTPPISVTEGLRQTVEWYLAEGRGGKR